MPQRLLRLVGIGVDLDAFHPLPRSGALREQLGLPPRGRVAAVVARLSQEKGHEVLLEAVASMPRRSDEDVCCFFVGDGPHRSTLEAKVQAHRLGDRVRFLGFRHDIQNVLSASDLLVLPSLEEGTPWVIAEALAMGVPVVATDVGGVREMLKDGEAGTLVAPGDPAALAKAIHDTLDADETVKHRLESVGRQHVEARYSKTQMLEQIFRLYNGYSS